MFLLLILPILAGGFFFCTNHIAYRYRLHNFEGQYLYLKSALFGFLLMLAFTLFALTLHTYAPQHLSPVLAIQFLMQGIFVDPNTEKTLAWVVYLSCGTLLFSWLFMRVGNFWKESQHDSQADAIFFYQGKLMEKRPLSSILFESLLDDDRQLMMSMDGGKVYVGRISDLGEPTESESMGQEISFVPVMSGYRDSASHKVTFTTHYEDLGVQTKFEIIVRNENILSASWFDFDTYTKFNTSYKALDTQKISTATKRKITGTIRVQ